MIPLGGALELSVLFFLCQKTLLLLGLEAEICGSEFKNIFESTGQYVRTGNGLKGKVTAK